MDVLPIKLTLNPPCDMSMTLALHWLQEPGSPTLGLPSLIPDSFPLNSETANLSSAHPSVVLPWSSQDSIRPMEPTRLRRAPSTSPLTKKSTKFKEVTKFLSHTP